MSRLDYMSFSCLRGDHARDWHRLSDLIDASQAAGYRMAPHEVYRAIGRLEKAPQKYGHARYGRQHLDAVVEYATARAQAQEKRDA